MIDGEFPPHAATPTVCRDGQHMETSKVPHAGRIQIVAAIVSALLVPDRDFAAIERRNGYPYEPLSYPHKSVEPGAAGRVESLRDGTATMDTGDRPCPGLPLRSSD
jgi:hypothetical protein